MKDTTRWLLCFSTALLGCGVGEPTLDETLDYDLESSVAQPITTAFSPKIIDHLKHTIPLGLADPAHGRKALEEHFSQHWSAQGPDARHEFPAGNQYPHIGAGKAFLDALDNWAAKSKAEGISTYGPNVYKEQVDGQTYFIVQYDEMRAGDGGSGWATRAIVHENGTLIGVGSQRLGSAQPSSDY
jgi:hypothetical protein